ncbi:protein downstream neighbor of son homolog [Contarinia nasturtii]|uniref:protein downstream neighbor of son homolog n=1 Tax=Contarinia nasturtii TaxID=265458 RepID=UPI0012D3DCD6|nr:protein downstream neighbor of son homolog [Contarinia nasturtii]
MSNVKKVDDKAWKTPNEILRLQRLKQKQKALQERLERPPAYSTRSSPSKFKITPSEKRKNPFLNERFTSDKKKARQSIPDTTEYVSEDSVFNLLANVSENEIAASHSKPSLNHKEPNSFINLLNQTEEADTELVETDAEKPTSHVPIDWSLKTKLRLLTKKPVPGDRLKCNEEASGITNFVRCADIKSSETSGLDISPAARFHQSTMYWQHPHLPWLTLFPRMSKANIGTTIGEAERSALARDWGDSFRALFQLVRSLQCPYFYMCANSFTVLFRAAGIGGKHETHALLTPTSRGLRSALKEEEIEFTMPLKKPSSDAQNKSLDSGNDTQSNSFSNLSEENAAETSADGINTSGNNDEGLDADDGSEEEEDEEKWLESMGVDKSEIKKIRTTNARRVHNEECAEDSTDQSILLIEGVECQALFNFLLNAKSTTTRVGRLAGIPPTLISPVAFPGATLKNNQIRASKVREQNIDYHSMEIRGVILPHTLHYLCNLVRETKDQFSMTSVNFNSTNALSKAGQKIIDDLNKENKEVTTETVFGRENLSDCGLPSSLLQPLCRVSNDAVRVVERMYFDKESGGYIWSEKK